MGFCCTIHYGCHPHNISLKNLHQGLSSTWRHDLCFLWWAYFSSYLGGFSVQDNKRTWSYCHEGWSIKKSRIVWFFLCYILIWKKWGFYAGISLVILLAICTFIELLSMWNLTRREVTLCNLLSPESPRLSLAPYNWGLVRAFQPPFID